MNVPNLEISYSLTRHIFPLASGGTLSVIQRNNSTKMIIGALQKPHKGLWNAGYGLF